MNIIFLDIDGVIIHENYKNEKQENLDEEKITLLKNIVEETDSKIVLISNWRVYNCEGEDKYPYSLLEKLLNKQGLSIYDDAPLFKLKLKGKEKDGIKFDPYTTRGGEINTYLNKHQEIDNFVIIDDDNLEYDYFNFENNFIQTDKKNGLTKEDVEKAINILNNIKLKIK